jgi:hypothetical protein
MEDRMKSLEDRAWLELAEELSLPAAARPRLERTGLFQRRVANIALRDFIAALRTAPPFTWIDWLLKRLDP